MDGDSIDWLLHALARTGPLDSLPVAGTLIGRYRLVAPIGRGGFGIVFKAVDTQLERDVALKVLHSNAGGAKGGERLLCEARAMARLKHENLLTIYDVGTFAEGQIFVAMELVDGTSLRGWLEERERAPGDILDMFLKAAAGLAAAHRAGVVHRDFKPDNVLVGRDATVRVADFGLADTSGREPAVRLGGTPRYMAPEQALGAAPNPKMDQYSFALALWEALTGQHPRWARDTKIAQHALPLQIGAALERALQIDPDQRFVSMEALVAALTPSVTRRSRAAAVDVIDVIDACYRTDGDDVSWLESIARATHAALGSQTGIFGYFYEVTNAGVLVPGQVFGWLEADGMSQLLSEVLVDASQRFSAASVRETFGRTHCVLGSQAGSRDTRQTTVEGFARHFAEQGWRDVLNISAIDPTGKGIGLGLPLRRETRLSPTKQTTWQRVASHMVSGYRLRRRLAAAESQHREAADAILTLAGKIAHLQPLAQSPALQEALSHAALAINHAHGPLRAEHPDAAVAGWRGLVDARWTLIDHADSDGKRFLLARRNDIDASGPTGLDARERQALAYTQLGHDEALIAYELGLSRHDLATLLQEARVKLAGDKK
jgi:hypothetical protein